MSRRSQKMGKDFWGPAEWTSLHVMGATFRPENADAFVEDYGISQKPSPATTVR